MKTNAAFVHMRGLTILPRASNRRRQLAVNMLMLSVVISPIALAGCAFVHDDSGAYAQGWRRARLVASVDALDTNVTAYKDCRKAQDGPGPSAHYVAASYSYGGNPNLQRIIIVPVELGSPVKPESQLQVNIVSCSAYARERSSSN